MEVWRGELDIAQGWRLEDIFVAGSAGDLKAAFIGGRKNVGAGFFDYAEREIAGSAEVHSVVAAYAAFREEQLESLLFGRRDRILLASQILIEARLRCDQRRFKGFDCARHVFECNGVGLAGKRLFEVIHVAGMLWSVFTVRSGVLFISTAACTGPIACSFKSFARPSQNCAMLKTAFNTVGLLRGPFCHP